MQPSELYYNQTKKKAFYNIMPLDNIPSVLQHGLLCYNKAKQLSHSSVAMIDVQEKRVCVRITNGMYLHDYASLYFNARNPMMYKRKDRASELCILAFSCEILNIKGCVVSDRNAASPWVRFYTPDQGIKTINFKKVFDRYWTNHPSEIEIREHKRIECAEVLIPFCVEKQYLLGGYVVNEDVKKRLVGMGFDKQIVVIPDQFFAERR